MNIKSIAAGVLALLAATAQAGEDQKTRIEIALDDDTSGKQSFVFDSQDAGFDLQSMVVGESRSITDRSGNTADLRRTESGFEIDIGGKTIELPNVAAHEGRHGEHAVELLVDGSDVVVAKDVKQVRVMKSHGTDGVTIISGKAIDAATRQRIAEVLSASGNPGEITFIDGSDLHDGEHQAGTRQEVRIIKKEVDVTN